METRLQGCYFGGGGAMGETPPGGWGRPLPMCKLLPLLAFLFKHYCFFSLFLAKANLSEHLKTRTFVPQWIVTQDRDNHHHHRIIAASRQTSGKRFCAPVHRQCSSIKTNTHFPYKIKTHTHTKEEVWQTACWNKEQGILTSLWALFTWCENTLIIRQRGTQQPLDSHLTTLHTIFHPNKWKFCHVFTFKALCEEQTEVKSCLRFCTFGLLTGYFSSNNDFKFSLFLIKLSDGLDYNACDVIKHRGLVKSSVDMIMTECSFMDDFHQDQKHTLKTVFVFFCWHDHIWPCTWISEQKFFSLSMGFMGLKYKLRINVCSV